MHPNPVFRDGIGDPLTWADRIGFAHIFVMAPGQPSVVHAPVSRFGERLRFHVARTNRAMPRIDGAAVLVSMSGAHGYVSPNWYAEPGNQVPTWNYEAVEFDGVARALDQAGLIAQLDALAERHEPPENPWRRSKMDPARFEAMLRAITGFEVTVTATRATAKLSQNKTEADRRGVTGGLRATHNNALATIMEARLG